MMVKVTKSQVKAIIRKEGKAEVTLYPCKMLVPNPWTNGYTTTINSLEELEKTIDNFSYYNCNNSEVGYYPKYYIDVVAS